MKNSHIIMVFRS